MLKKTTCIPSHRSKLARWNCVLCDIKKSFIHYVHLPEKHYEDICRMAFNEHFSWIAIASHLCRLWFCFFCSHNVCIYFSRNTSSSIVKKHIMLCFYAVVQLWIQTQCLLTHLEFQRGDWWCNISLPLFSWGSNGPNKPATESCERSVSEPELTLFKVLFDWKELIHRDQSSLATDYSNYRLGLSTILWDLLTVATGASCHEL